MKRTIRILSALCLCLLTLTFALSSCGSKRGYATLAIGNNEEESVAVIKVDLDKIDGWNEETGSVTLENVLKSLQADGKLTYTMQTGDYGAYLTGVNDTKQDVDKGIYLFFWTSVTAEQDTSDFGTKKEYEGNTLVSAAVGASAATMCDGSVIYIGTVQY